MFLFNACFLLVLRFKRLPFSNVPAPFDWPSALREIAVGWTLIIRPRRALDFDGKSFPKEAMAVVRADVPILPILWIDWVIICKAFLVSSYFKTGEILYLMTWNRFSRIAPPSVTHALASVAPSLSHTAVATVSELNTVTGFGSFAWSWSVSTNMDDISAASLSPTARINSPYNSWLVMAWISRFLLGYQW